MSEYCAKATLRLLAERNRRGLTTADLVYSILEVREIIETLDTAPEDILVAPCPPGCSEAEYKANARYYWNCILADALKELQRRRHINETYVKAPEREIIQAIKADMPLAAVLEWYTKVIYSNREQMKFHCTLHGEDKTPSGIIYVKESRWWCFACNKGGDVFDAVQAFERVDLPQAIKKLATFLGIELRPLAGHQPQKATEKRLQEIHG